MSDTIISRLRTLPPQDRRLVIVLTIASLLALIIGLTGGLLTALVRAGFLDVLPESGYRYLSVHGVSAFFYWLYFAQAALVLSFSAVERGNGGGPTGLLRRSLASLGVGAMMLGFALGLVATMMGSPPLYDGNAELLADEPLTVLVFSAGYVLLGLGLMLVPVSAIATLLSSLGRDRRKVLDALGFALLAWSGFLIVSGFAAIHAFLPSLLWSLGLADFPVGQETGWHILFHNLHYLPLMATVLVWYILMQALTGAKSAFGARFSKIVFSLYLVFVPPTSLYHMFLDPGLPEYVKVAGSALSLFVSVPTLTAFLVIVASLEVHARAAGATGLFGWIRKLPWEHPATTAASVAVINMMLGISLAFVLIQQKLAPLLSDTFFVPGYFHFFTVGTVSLSLLAGLSVLLPGLTGRTLRMPRLLRTLPWVASAGLLVFGGAGVIAGFIGVPRRVMDVSYGGEAPAVWSTLMALVGAGGSVMALALLAYAATLLASVVGRRGAHDSQGFVGLQWVVLPSGNTAAWTGPLSILVIAAAMYGFGAIGFELLQAVPLIATGTAGH
jgi:cytochrome c oxidase subunit 1